MGTRSRWQRVRAEHWVHRLLATQTFVLVLVTLWLLLTGWALGLAFLAVIPAVYVGLSGWMTAAWRRGRPWAWWVATVLSGMRVVGSLVALLEGDASWLDAALLVFDGVLLAFLFHPDGRARVVRPPAEPVDARLGSGSAPRVPE